MRPFEVKKGKVAKNGTRRRLKQFKLKNAAKLRDDVGVVENKKVLKTCFLNVDGLSEATLEDIKGTVHLKSPDLVFLVETKRRKENTVADVNIPGYRLYENLRSDQANDKDGGGIAVYTKLEDGILFKLHTPDIMDPAAAFVDNERVWITVQSQSCKTAICGVYLGCQYPDNRNSVWNDTIYETLQQESFSLRSQGYRVVYLGDFNGHVGNKHGEGVPGNKPDINHNGRKFLDFLSRTDSVHINGSTRVPGRWDTRLTAGLWTRQRCGSSSILDFGVISSEHLSSIISMKIDDHGEFGTLSDHNWIFLDLCDKFVKQRRISTIKMKRSGWDIRENQDWSGFRKQTLDSVATLDTSSPSNLASSISASIISAMHAHIGLKSDRPKNKPRQLPPALIAEFRLLRSLEKQWKTLNSENANAVNEEVKRAEAQYIAQKGKTEGMLFLHRASKRPSVLKQCRGNSTQARRNFWAFVSPKKKQNSEISAVISPSSGVVRCNLDDIRNEVEGHLTTVFKGSPDKIAPEPASANDHNYSTRNSTPDKAVLPDHPYSTTETVKLPKCSDGKELDSDPNGWLNTDFTMAEVKEMIVNLKNNKAKGWDSIPNEALKNLPDEMISMVAQLFSKIKLSGTLPEGWNRGRITLVHKYGLRELLGNYRPITVIISLSGLYSRVLNERLTKVVEKHDLLGEVQNGFRKERGGADNSFILNTILWKAKAMKSKTHLAFLDISKAYDSVNRSILWKKLSSMGFGGHFLSTLRSLYRDDSVDCMVNGLLTKPIYLRRGLRQGCSLSPMLFALYISDIGRMITSSSLGFRVNNVTVSGLLFADDIVIITRKSEELKVLLDEVKAGFDKLKLTISHSKSQIISPDDVEWNLVDNTTKEEKSLEQVSLYKYLGIWTYNSVFKTGVEKQKACAKTALKYKGSCINVSRMGPDIVDVIQCTWLNVAVPAILNGCEFLPFCDTRISEIERIQSQIAKYALGIPVSSPNFCAQTELGWKSFRQMLYERQLKFYFRVLFLDESRWVHQALLDHLSGSWASPYLAYILGIRSKLNIFAASSQPRVWKHLTNKYFLSQVNTKILLSTSLKPIEGLLRLNHVYESKWSTVITEFRLGCEGLGNKQPRDGHTRKVFCPVCPDVQPNNGHHLLFHCSSLSALRAETGITSFNTACRIKNIDSQETYTLFITGYNSNRKEVSLADFIDRAKCMNAMRERWLSKW